MQVNIPVKVSPHRTLNTIKGVIRCSDMKFTPVEVIVDNLKEQGISEAQKIVITTWKHNYNCNHHPHFPWQYSSYRN